MKQLICAMATLTMAAAPAGGQTWELEGFGGANSPSVFLLDIDSVTSPTATTRDATILFVQTKDDADGTAAIAFAATFDCSAKTMVFHGYRHLNAAGALLSTAPASDRPTDAADGTPLGGIRVRACTGKSNGMPSIKGAPPIAQARASAAVHYAPKGN